MGKDALKLWNKWQKRAEAAITSSDYHNRDGQRPKVLLMPDVSVYGDNDIKFKRSRFEEVAVSEVGPAHLLSGSNVVA